MSLFSTKPISRIIAEAEETGAHTLKKTLTALDLTMLGIGGIIGTGIFVLTGQAAGKHAGPAVIISMILAGIVSAFAALCYSEFAAAVPICGVPMWLVKVEFGEIADRQEFECKVCDRMARKTVPRDQHV